ncbi:phosphoserine transaminase [Chromatiales bacterium (ex Bugula neritina AB1)]|nr:phosphoserine transaminase [Chromatiales bacterium (ex Bugula neritina AB1)]
MSRVYNFSAGPAALPEEVLQQAAGEMTDWRQNGAGVMELSHRSKAFMSIAEEAEADLRELLSVPDNYAVLFLQGGASAQFGLIPMNLLGDKTNVDYVNTGQWSTKAIKEASKFAAVNVAASSEAGGFNTVPAQSEWTTFTDAAYLHITPNETIGGVEYGFVPDTGAVPLVADMSSTILSRPLDVSKYGLIYAGAQKNIGPSGLTVVIVDKSLFGKAATITPDAFNYQLQAAAGSMLNTPPTYGWYIAGLVFKWLKQRGGLDAMQQANKRKANKLYAAIDSSSYYSNPVTVDSRSWMNVPFICGDSKHDTEFLAGAVDAGLHSLKGHRSVGGMRASIYNAMPESGVDSLISYMAEFERTHG